MNGYEQRNGAVQQTKELGVKQGETTMGAYEMNDTNETRYNERAVVYVLAFAAVAAGALLPVVKWQFGMLSLMEQVWIAAVAGGTLAWIGVVVAAMMYQMDQARKRMWFRMLRGRVRRRRGLIAAQLAME